jgi:hypothetical protein
VGTGFPPKTRQNQNLDRFPIHSNQKAIEGDGRRRLIDLVHCFITKNANLRVSLRNFPDDASSGKRDIDI